MNLKRGSARFALPVAAASLLGSLPAMAIEEPAYEIVERLGAAEIRAYELVVVAETVVDGEFDRAGNAAFRRLAGYIFGGNRVRAGATESARIEMTAPVGMRPSPKEEKAKIAMTAPVAMRPAGATGNGVAGSWVVSFTMPRAWTLATLPVPNDPLVTLREEPARTVAALRFSGFWSEEKFFEKERELRAALAGSAWQIVGPAESARYNPPWTPWFLRRNEVQLEVRRRDG